jgi:hypothetical protein
MGDRSRCSLGRWERRRTSKTDGRWETAPVARSGDGRDGKDRREKQQTAKAVAPGLRKGQAACNLSLIGPITSLNKVDALKTSTPMRLGYLSPAAYERLFYVRQAAA